MRDDDAAYAYSLSEVGRRLGVSAATVRRMVAAGELWTITVWGKRRITHHELMRYLGLREQSMTLPVLLHRAKRRGGTS